MPCGNLRERCAERFRRSSDVFKRFRRTVTDKVHRSASSKRSSSPKKTFFPRDSPSQFKDAGEIFQLSKKRKIEEEVIQEPNATFEVERLPTPTKSAMDKNTYSVIRLSNGVVATIIAEEHSGHPRHSKGGNEMRLRTESAPKLVNESRLRETSFAKLGTANSSQLHKNEEELERDFSLAKPQSFAACAVTVEVGSFNDPEQIPGLCHLLEHVLPMGSDKFKGEDEFDAFLGRNGGSFEAETETEYMTFYFECQDTFLYAAMEMFSRFFVAPLIKWDSVRRERLAVASEFAEQSSSDNARRMQVICMSANPSNPARKFTWGNLDTLKNNVSDEQLLSALKEFRQTNFVADKVKVAVQASISAETLEGWVNMLFSGIPKRGSNPEATPAIETPFDKAKFCKLYKVQSVGHICDVNINWVLPSMLMKYRNKPIEYLSYVIGAEGEGSLIAYLRGQQMALYLSSEIEEGGLVTNSLYSIFTICVSLTEDGRKNVKNVVNTVFGYLKMLRSNGPSHATWSELQNIAEIGFKFNRSHSPGENVRVISQAMTFFPPKDYLTGWTQFFEYSGEEIENCLSFLTPTNANILLHMKNHEDELDKEEQWFKTHYRVDDIPINWIQEWNTAEPETSFHLPLPNPYIAEDFSIVDKGIAEEFPKKISDTKYEAIYELWHKTHEFNTPHASVNILLGTPQERQTVQHIVCQMLFAKMFIYQMIDELYFAQVAHIEHKMISTEYGLEISIYGVSQKLPKVLREVAKGLVEFGEKAHAQQYMMKYLKVVLERNIVNTLSNGALLLDDIRKSLTSSSTFTSGEKYQYVKAITKEQIDYYWQEMLTNVNVVALIQGNFTVIKAKSMMEEFTNILKATSKGGTVAQPAARMIPTGESLISIAAFQQHEENCYTHYYYQFGQGSVTENVALQLFVAAMSEPLFDELRTKEQLGYSVSVNVSEVLGVVGVVITVNSQMSRHSPEYIRTRIDTFVRDYIKYFKVMSRGEFEDAKNVFLNIKQMKPENLKEESSRNWWEIKNRGEFDRYSKEIEAIARLDKKSTVKVVDRTMDYSKANVGVRKLVIQIVGFKPDSSIDEDDRSTIVDDIVVYRNAYTEVFTPSSKIVKDVLAWKNSLPTYSKQ